MDIIFLIYRLRLQSIFSSFKKVLAILGGILFAAYSITIVNYSFTHFSPSEELFIVSLNIALFTLLSIFFPSVRNYPELVARNYPLSSFHRFAINWLNDTILQLSFIPFVFFCAIYTITSRQSGLENNLFIYFVLLHALISKRIIHTLLFKKLLKKHALKLILSICLLAGYVYFLVQQFSVTGIPWYAHLLLTGILFSIAYFVEECWVSVYKRSQKTFFTSNAYLQMLFGNSKMLLSLVMYLLMKVFFLTFLTNLFYTKGKYPPFFLITIFISPLAFFNYTMNNLYGFFPKYWLTLFKSGLPGKHVFLNYFKFTSMVFILDVFLSGSFMVFNQTIALKALYAYLSTVFVMYPLGFFWSYSNVKVVQKMSFLNVQALTGIAATFGSIFILGIIVLLGTFVSYFYTMIICFLIGGLLIKVLPAHYESRELILYHKLFKNAE